MCRLWLTAPIRARYFSGSGYSPTSQDKFSDAASIRRRPTRASRSQLVGRGRQVAGNSDGGSRDSFGNAVGPICISRPHGGQADFHLRILRAAGHYSNDRNVFTAQKDVPPLHIPINGGVYRYGTRRPPSPQRSTWPAITGLMYFSALYHRGIDLDQLKPVKRQGTRRM